MVRLKYNLDEIRTGYETGRCRAKLKKIAKKSSRAKKPMLQFDWVILTGENKGQKISSYPSLQTSALGNLKEHLEALGMEGKVDKSSDSLLGKIAVLVITESPAREEGGRPFIGVGQVLPKNAPLSPVDDDEDDDDDDDYDEDDDEDDDEFEDDDDEDWDDDDDE